MKLLALALVAAAFALLPSAAAQEETLALRPRESGCPEGMDPCWETPLLNVTQGADVTLVLDARDAESPHNLHVLEPVEKRTVVTMGENATLTFRAEEGGRIEFVCDVHPQTMVGTLVVEHPRVRAGEVVAAFVLTLVNGSEAHVDAAPSTAAADATYRWDWGDGATSEGRTASHRYEGGDHRREITLVVVEPDGAAATARRTVFLSYPDQPRLIFLQAQEKGCPEGRFCWGAREVLVQSGEYLALEAYNPPENRERHQLRVGQGTGPGRMGDTLAPGDVHVLDMGQVKTHLTFQCAIHPEMQGRVVVSGAPDEVPPLPRATPTQPSPASTNAAPPTPAATPAAGAWAAVAALATAVLLCRRR